MHDEVAAQAAKRAAQDMSVTTAVKAELAKLPYAIADGVTARAALVLAETIDRASDPSFRQQSVSASIKQLQICLRELRDAASESAPVDDRVAEIAKRHARRTVS